MEQQIQQNPFSEIATRLNETEEKQRLLKDRLLLIGENLISTREETEQELSQIKQNQRQLEEELKQLKQTNERILYELQNIAKKSELQILQKQFRMFEPLEIARIKDVEKIVKQEIKKLDKIK